mmetsp:Transcript_48939/g.153696  ORF Transcript_48939/g.153696 Transcript_48939/m.153696 type:complete len:83 (-) Transcript_48939:1015-1263(-)
MSRNLFRYSHAEKFWTSKTCLQRSLLQKNLSWNPKTASNLLKSLHDHMFRHEKNNVFTCSLYWRFRLMSCCFVQWDANIYSV